MSSQSLTLKLLALRILLCIPPRNTTRPLRVNADGILRRVREFEFVGSRQQRYIVNEVVRRKVLNEDEKMFRTLDSAKKSSKNFHQRKKLVNRRLQCL